MKKYVVSLIAVLFALVNSPSTGQVMRFDFSTILNQEESSVENRKATVLDIEGREAIHLNGQQGAGVLWLNKSNLKDGTIEVDVRGRNTPGRSFVGIAFHRETDEIYEVIYLRPFNFQNADRSNYSMQYTFEPEYGWRRLREEHPGKYEAAIKPAPNPTDWLRLRIELQGATVRVYANDLKDPSLVVERIGNVESGKVGLWVGNNSEGDFANLVVKPG